MNEEANPLRKVRHISDVVASALHDLAMVGKTDKEIIRTHPGKGQSNISFGMARVTGRAKDRGHSDQSIAVIEDAVHDNFAKGAALCESPIERNMLAALLTGDWGDFDALPPIVHNCARGSGEVLPVAPVVIVPQMPFVRYRLDFGVVVVKDRRLQIVCVECDGAAYHQDAQKENDRTAYLRSWDVPVFKVKGADLYADAVNEADRVINGIVVWAFS
jgi:hypothetical protein